MFNVLIIIEDYTPCSSMDECLSISSNLYIHFIYIIRIIIEDCTRYSTMELNVYLFP